MENIRATAFDVFDEARLLGEHTDMIIKSGDREFQVHKIIMCGCSTYFRDLFSNNRNSPPYVCEFPGISQDIMSLIIQYAYTRSVLITQEENVVELLMAADMTLVSGLVDACCQFLESHLCPENCIGFWRFTEDFFSCSKLHCKAKHYILQHFEEVLLVPEEFLELSLEQLEEIIDEDELNVKKEEVVFEAVLRWINHDPENRGQHIAVLLPKVRLGLMTSDYFINNIKCNALVMENEACLPVMNEMNTWFDLNVDEPIKSELMQLTRPRLPSSILLAIGGLRDDGNYTSEIEAYDVKADCWVSVTQEDDRPRAHSGTAVLDEFVYCIGGYDRVEVFNSVRKLNPITQTWQEVAPMYERRCGLSVAVLDELIYAIGGSNRYQWLKTVERYDPNTNQWTMMSPMNVTRSEASATSLQGRIYICGGFSGVECLDSAETFDPETNQWTLIAPMSSPRSDLGVIACEDQVYAVGGFDGTRRLRSVEVFNPQAEIWRDVKSMTNPRMNFGIEVVDGQLFVVGGFNALGNTCEVEYYNPATDEWFDANEMAVSRSSLSCVVVTRHKRV